MAENCNYLADRSGLFWSMVVGDGSFIVLSLFFQIADLENLVKFKSLVLSECDDYTSRPAIAKVNLQQMNQNRLKISRQKYDNTFDFTLKENLVITQIHITCSRRMLKSGFLGAAVSRTLF
jgi:hypothetical protein